MSNTIPSFRLTWAQIAIAIVIVLGAIALRMAVVVDRAAGDERFIPPFLSDSEVYHRFAVDILHRQYPFRPYDYQPGVMYAYAGLIAIVGPSVAMLRFALCVVDGVAVGMVIAAGWLLTRRAWGGWLAGLLMALYPVSVYYATTILIEPFAAMLLAVWLVIALWQMESPTRLKTILLGLFTGFIFVTRSNVAVVTLIYLLWWAAQRPGWRTWLTDFAIIAAGTILVISPFTAWNIYSGGKFQLLQSGGWWQLYSANNRDGDGTGGRGAAFDAEDHPNETDQTHWKNALIRDIEINPLRFGGLLMRKTAIFWSDAEPGNNDDFYVIRQVSPILQALPPVSFPYLAVVAFIGLWGLGFERRDKALFFCGMIGALFGGVLISFALSRFRYPVVIPLFPLAAYGIVRLVELVGTRPALSLSRLSRIQWIGRVGVPLGLMIILWAFPRWALSGSVPPVPPKSTYTALPGDAIPLHVTFGDEVVLEGWRYAPYTRWWNFADQGWADLSTFPAYTVELFWSIKAPTDVEYQFSIGLSENDISYGALDRALGTVSYPPNTTNQWQPNIIYSELVSFQPAQDMPPDQSIPVRVGVYTREGTIFTQGDKTTPLPITDPAGLTSVVLQTVAVYKDGPAALPIPDTALHFGTPQTGEVDLLSIDKPAAAPGETAQWTFTWQAASDLKQDANLFIHMMDANNELAAQFSGMPLPNLATSNWRTGTPLIATLPVTMPDKPGDYTVYMGLIDTQTGERLPINAPDNRPQIGTLSVK